MTSSAECTGATVPTPSLPVHGVQGSTRRHQRPATVGLGSIGPTGRRGAQQHEELLGPPAASHPWAPEKSLAQDNTNNTAASRSSSSSSSSETILRPGSAQLPQTSMERINVLTQALVQAHQRDDLPNQSAKVITMMHSQENSCGSELLVGSDIEFLFATKKMPSSAVFEHLSAINSNFLAHSLYSIAFLLWCSISTD